MGGVGCCELCPSRKDRQEIEIPIETKVVLVYVNEISKISRYVVL